MQATTITRNITPQTVPRIIVKVSKDKMEHTALLVEELTLGRKVYSPKKKAERTEMTGVHDVSHLALMYLE